MTAGVERLVGFGRLLRARGLPVGTGRILSFCRAVGELGLADRESLYWAGRATLVSSKDHFAPFDDAFERYFGPPRANGPISHDRAGSGEQHSNLRPELTADVELVTEGWVPAGESAETEGEVAVRIAASEVEVLKKKSFSELSDEERVRAATLIGALSVGIPRRHTRRLRPARKVRQLDLRRTLRHSLRTQGEPFRRAFKDRNIKLRPLLVILDVSGSMSAYSRALLQFGFAAMAAGRKVEVFCFGTRLTRVRRTLRTKDPDRALEEVAELVRDWEGGTRIGESLRDLINNYGQSRFLRGAVVVLCSDGLERGDPRLLAAQVAKLGRLAHRVVWVNPLKGSPEYQPLARGMAAALPHIDLFLSGHNIDDLEVLGELLGR